jgi:putative endopeptidase
MRLNIVWYSVPFLFLAACNSNPGRSNKPDVLASNLDTTVNPADDFFEYANGGWIKKNPIPPDESGWGLFQVIPDETLNRLKDINDEAAKATAAKGSAEQKISDFWKAAMDSANIEEKGIQPLQPYLDKIASIKDVATLQSTIAELDKMGVSTAFGLYVGQDPKISTLEALQMFQAGIGLPEREFYFKTDSTSVNIRNAM